MPRPIEVIVTDPALELDTSSVVDCLNSLDGVEEFTVPDGSIEVAFFDESTCSILHRDFFGDPEPTDVMTFPGDPEDRHAGDIAICPGVAARASQQLATRFDEELTLYLVHAWLHLAGLDDRDQANLRQMRAAEERLMTGLRENLLLLRAAWKT